MALSIRSDSAVCFSLGQLVGYLPEAIGIVRVECIRRDAAGVALAFMYQGLHGFNGISKPRSTLSSQFDVAAIYPIAELSGAIRHATKPGKTGTVLVRP
jgi:hypothetical protein